MYSTKLNVVQIVDSNQRDSSGDFPNPSTTKDSGNVVCLPLPHRERLAKIEKSLGNKLFDDENHLSNSVENTLTDLVMSFFTKYAGIDFEFLRPKDIRFRDLIRDFKNYSSDSNIYPAVAGSSIAHFILSNFTGPISTVIMPFKDLRLVEAEEKTQLHIDFDHSILKHLIDEYGFKEIIRADTKKMAQKITNECRIRVQFVDRIHKDLLRAAMNNHPVQIIFIDYDKYDWLQREGHLIEGDDLVHLDSTLWNVKYESDRFSLIRSHDIKSNSELSDV